MRENRREELAAQALHAGHSREYADRIYDVAVEEHLDPSIAFRVVLSGVGVRELGNSPPDNWEEAQVDAPPEWIEKPPPEEEATRERHMRLTFRRLRGLIEEHGSADAALQVFEQQPDVGAVEY